MAALSDRRVWQIERTIRRIRNGMMRQDEDYQNKAGRVIEFAKKRCADNWRARMDAYYSRYLDRIG